MSEVDTNKRALRRFLRAQRASLGVEAREEASAAIAGRLFELEEWRAARVVLCYLSFGDEVATGRVVQRAWADGKRLAAPRVTGPRKMEWHWLCEGDPLETSRFGIPEPAGESATLVDLSGLGTASVLGKPRLSNLAPTLCETTSTSDHLAMGSPQAPGTVPALAIVPALAFDRQCRRIGYGGGYYDAFLAGFGGATAGLCFEPLLQDDFASIGCVEPHDIPVDTVISERNEFRRA